LLKAGLLPKLRIHQDMVFIIKLAAMLKLVAGEVHESVANRRLHLDNRITNPGTNFSETKFKAYQYLLRWSKDAPLAAEKQRIIRRKYRKLALRYFKETRKYHLALYYYALLRVFDH